MRNPSEIRELVSKSLEKLERWVEDNEYKGYDPADGLTSPLRSLTFGNFHLERILLQLVWKSPVNFRPFIGIKPLRTNIGTGYMAWGYLSMLKLTGHEEYKNKAIACLEWLRAHKSPYFEEYCWGKMFDFVSRGGRQGKFEPITVWTSLIGHAFLDAYELLGDQQYLDIADSICKWMVSIPRNKTESGACISYTAHDDNDTTIHNQSMLGASMLARTWRANGVPEYLEIARQAIEYTCTRQRTDGSWYYGEHPKYHWIDSFHTGYNLDALKCYTEESGDTSYETHLKNGFSYFCKNFFGTNGEPKYYHNRTYPIDSQCASQAIETLTNFADLDDKALKTALKVAVWTIENMQDKNGYFYYRKYPFMTTKVPMIHWAQATTYRALSQLLLKTKDG